MSIATTLARYLPTNAACVQMRMQGAGGRTKALAPINDTQAIPLTLSIWPLTLTWRMRPSSTETGARIEDRFQFAVSDKDWDIQPGDVLVGYPKPETKLEVASVNLYDDGTQPMPHLGGLLRHYSHQG